MHVSVHVAAYLTFSYNPGTLSLTGHHASNGASSEPSRLTTHII